VVQGCVGKAVQVGGGVAGEQCDVSASELLIRRPSLDTAAALDLAS
jgi:hypothetical protein